MPYIQPAARGVPLGGVHRDQRHHGIASAQATPAGPRELPDPAAETPQQRAGRFERDMFRYRAQLYSAALRLTRNGSGCRRSCRPACTGQVADGTPNALRNTRAYSSRSCYPLLVLHNGGQKERPGFSTFRGSRAALIAW